MTLIMAGKVLTPGTTSPGPPFTYCDHMKKYSHFNARQKNYKRESQLCEIVKEEATLTIFAFFFLVAAITLRSTCKSDYCL